MKGSVQLNFRFHGGVGKPGHRGIAGPSLVTTKKTRNKQSEWTGRQDDDNDEEAKAKPHQDLSCP